MSFGNTSQASSIRVPHAAHATATIQRDVFAASPDRYGVFAFWPHDDVEWVHPYDRALASDFVPSDRVWQRFRGNDDHDLFCQGDVMFRAQARMWQQVEIEGYWVGDWIEILSSHGQRRPLLAMITEIRWNRIQRRFEYALQRHGRDLCRRYESSAFRAARSLNWWQSEGWRGSPLRDGEEMQEWVPGFR